MCASAGHNTAIQHGGGGGGGQRPCAWYRDASQPCGEPIPPHLPTDVPRTRDPRGEFVLRYRFNLSIHSLIGRCCLSLLNQAWFHSIGTNRRQLLARRISDKFLFDILHPAFVVPLIPDVHRLLGPPTLREEGRGQGQSSELSHPIPGPYLPAISASIVPEIWSME